MNEPATNFARHEAIGGRRPSPRHLIVAIGASAGGLQAMRAFLSAIPAQTGLALVLAQHAAPGEDDLLLSALRPISPLPVEIAVDGAPVTTDRLHVAPGGSVTRIRNGRFVVRPARGPVERRTGVDRLFRSLAEDAGPCAVGIVLSGSGSDGALGLEAIGAAGGLAMAQEPDTASQAEMPGSAASLGACDHVLPPEDLARTLMAHAAHLRSLPDGADAVARHREIHAALRQVCAVLKRVTGNDFRHYKTTTMIRRLERRMQVLQIGEIGAYLDRLSADEAEARTLFRELLIGVTSFFRDPEAFESLAARALRPLLAGRSAADELRIWVPGCATGEEAYSLAILAREAMEGIESPPRVQIFASDIDERALATARRGSYPQGIAARMSPERLQRFFVKKGRRYQVTPELREMCLFTAHNLVSDPPFSRLDVISCRNLLIYMGPPLQKKLFPVFHYALKPGGYLFLGSSESLAGHGELFRSLDAKSRIAQRKETRGALPGGLRDFGGQGLPGFRATDQMTDPDLGAVAQRILLTEFAPRYAIVSEEGQVVHLSEGSDKYLQPPVGSFSNTITRMARRGLSAGLRSAFSEAVQRRRTVVHELPAVQTSEGLAHVRLTVQPMPELGHGEGLFMVVFENLGDAVRPTGEGSVARPDAEAVIETLERELHRAREELERAVQDQEAANEELKSSNEELLSMNEELQSANEELEASKEEVQAANRQLEQANADLENLLRSTQIATVFLDRDGLIRTFTPAAAEIYNLRATDTGRPLEELRSRLRDLPDVPAYDAVAPLTDPLEHVARHADGRWFLRRVLPYHGTEGTADGVLVTFVDISTQKRAEEEQRRATDLLAAVGRTTPDLIYVKDREGRLLYANPSTWAAIGRRPEEALGRTEREFLHDDAEAEAIIAADRAVMESGTTRISDEPVTGPDGVTRVWRSTKSPMRDESGAVVGLVGVSTDITAQRVAEKRLQDSEARYRALVEVSPQVVWFSDAEGSITYANPQWTEFTGLSLEETAGEGWTTAIRPDERERVRSVFAHAVATGEDYEVEIPFRRASDGAYRWHLARGKPLGDATGQVTRWAGVAVDVHERHEAADRLRETSRRLDAVLNNTTMAVFVMDERQHCVFANAAAEQMTGYSFAEMQGRPLHDVVHHTRPDGSHYPLEECPIDRAFPENNQTRGEEIFVHKDGRFYPVGFTASPIRDEASRTVGTIIEARNIAEERAARAALAESEAKFRTIANAMPQMVWSTTAEGYHDFYNDRWYEFTGVPQGSTDGDGWAGMFHPADRDRAWAAWRNSLASGEPYEVEYRLRDHSGAWRWVLGRALPVRDEEGQIIRWMGTCTDIEERKRIEAELADALAAKEVLLQEVNHRVKNSLQLVTALLQLQAAQARDSELRAALGEAQARLHVIASLHQRLYSTSQHDRVDFGDYLRGLATETLRSLDAGGRIQLEADLADGVILPLAEAAPLALVVSELVTNAVKYAFTGRDGGALQVVLARTPQGVSIEVADDGAGLPEGFDAQRSGGLGMRIVTSLVRQVGGRLSVGRAEPGTRVVIDLPGKR